ncbi:hypothetical protein CFter6_5198 [Collimonas fungivorans]|uniref:Uncharacterized protein n=1 Tax=Collimonas fungivorans TaxID=158899 RepID=A0A127PJ07_9BURK|nr:hypothetical protein CFter6_5198 [Collimonas fungivorans]
MHHNFADIVFCLVPFQSGIVNRYDPISLKWQAHRLAFLPVYFQTKK